jgi:hypothetical protein
MNLQKFRYFLLLVNEFLPYNADEYYPKLSEKSKSAIKGSLIAPSNPQQKGLLDTLKGLSVVDLPV